MKRSLAFTLGGLAFAAWGISRAVWRDFSLSGKIFIVTGGSRGLGLVLARQICQAGGRVALLARDLGELQRAREELRSLGADVFTRRCDLLEREQIETAVRDVVAHFGALDVVINNAGVIEVGPFEHMKREDFERALALHFWAPFTLINEALPHLRARGGGRIVNISSIGGRIAVPHMSPYSASKFALVGLSDALRTELARDNIHVTTVTPGLMRTGSHVNAKFKGDHGAEYSWFATSASLPLASIAADRAAKKILEACRRGRSSLTMPFLTHLGVVAAATFPNLAGETSKFVNALLPGPTDSSGDELRSGWKSRERASMPSWLTHFGDRATQDNNEARG